MGKFNDQTIGYLTKGGGPVTVQALQAQGLPPEGAQINTKLYAYRDTLYLPLETLGTMKRTTAVFGREPGSGAARNLKLPTTLQLAFFNYVITCFVNFSLDPELDPDTNALTGSSLAEAINIFLQATRLTIDINQMRQLDIALAAFTNFQMPSILSGLEGAASAAPFAQFPPAHPEHHRVNLDLDPPLIWPPVADIVMNVITDVPGWYSDANSGILPAAPVLSVTENPWKIKLQPTVSFEFFGNQGKSNM